jgi:WD40 repeat protein
MGKSLKSGKIYMTLDLSTNLIRKFRGNKCNQAFGHRGVTITTKYSYGVCGVKIKRQWKDFLVLLPIELSLNIIKDLDAKSLCRAEQVSRRWREIINTDKLWKRRFDNDGFVLAEETAIRAFPNLVGPPSPMHLFKSLYRRHYLIRKDWMDVDIKPRHIAFCAHRNKMIACLQFDTEKILVGYDEDACIEVYDIKTGALRKRLQGHEGSVWALEFHRNALVSCSTDHSVRVWDIEKGVCTQVLKGHTDTVRCLKIVMPARVGMMPDGQAEMVPKVPLIITGSRDSTLRVWKLPLSEDKPFFPTGPSQTDLECLYFVRTLLGHHDSVRAIAAHGDTLVSGSYDCSVRVWEISTGETKHCLRGHTQKVYSVVLDYKRNRCISRSIDNIVKVWCLETGGLLYNLEGHTNLAGPGLLDLSYDRLVSAAADSTLRIWNPENGQCRSTLIGHTGAITCFQHDDQKVISGSNQTLKVWNVQNGEFAKDLLTDLTAMWQVKFDERRCVAAVKRNQRTYIEVSNLSEPVFVLRLISTRFLTLVLHGIVTLKISTWGGQWLMYWVGRFLGHLKRKFDTIRNRKEYYAWRKRIRDVS